MGNKYQCSLRKGSRDKLNMSRPFSLSWILFWKKEEKNPAKLYHCCLLYTIAQAQGGCTAKALKPQSSKSSECICITSPWKRCHRELCRDARAATSWIREYRVKGLSLAEVRIENKRPIRHTTATYQAWQCADSISASAGGQSGHLISVLRKEMHLCTCLQIGWEITGVGDSIPANPHNILWPTVLTAVQHMT